MKALERIVEASVRKRGLVLALSGLVTAAALLTIPRLSIDAVPDVTNVQVTILTTAPGLSPAEVEQYLTYPIETAMNGIPGLREVRSVSKTALSSVTLVFSDETNVWFARQLVSERLKLAEADIPPGYGRPELAPVSTGLGEIYEFYLESDRHSPMELRTLLDWVVAYRLRSVPGVIEVNTMGGRGQAVPGRAGPAEDGRVQADAARGADRPAAEQHQRRRRLHREERRADRHPRRGAVQGRRGHRRHGARGRRGRHAHAAAARGGRARSAPRCATAS